jgi:hypothetical protein
MTSDEKRGNPKMQGAQKERPPKKKEATQKLKGLEMKEQPTLIELNTKNHQLTKPSSDNPIVKGEGDAFRFNHKM